MYIKHLNSTVSRPIKELKGFKRIAIQPGKTKTVTLILNRSQLAYWNAQQRRFMVEKEKIQILMGSSSADIRFQKTILIA